MFDVFFQAVGIKRPHGSLAEAEFVAWLANRYQPTLIDAAGNLHFDMRIDGETTLFVAHTDTAHWSKGGPNKYEVKGDMVHAVDDCLGADDGAGIQVLAYLMEQEVPAYYIFTRGEECGGIGATYLADEMPDLLREFKRAIAFDRNDSWSVITHQGGSRCCSKAFGEALAGELSAGELLYATDDGGIFTDTALWTEIIPECTNLSVGYWAQHTQQEKQDLDFLRKLMETAASLDWEALPTSRSVDGRDEEDSIHELWAAMEVAAYDRKPAKLKKLLVAEGYITKSAADKLRWFEAAEEVCLSFWKIRAGKIDVEKASKMVIKYAKEGLPKPLPTIKKVALQ